MLDLSQCTVFEEPPQASDAPFNNRRLTAQITVGFTALVSESELPERLAQIKTALPDELWRVIYSPATTLIHRFYATALWPADDPTRDQELAKIYLELCAALMYPSERAKAVHHE